MLLASIYANKETTVHTPFNKFDLSDIWERNSNTTSSGRWHEFEKMAKSRASEEYGKRDM